MLFQRPLNDPLINFDSLINKSEESLESTKERIAKFLRGAGLKLTETNVGKFFRFKLKEPVSKRTVQEIFYRIKEDKHMAPLIEKRGEQALKKITGRKRVTGRLQKNTQAIFAE